MRRLFPSWRFTARRPLRKMGALVPLFLTPLPIDAKPSGEGARDARDRLSIPLQEATGQQDAPFPLALFSSPSPSLPYSPKGRFSSGEVGLSREERELRCLQQTLMSQKS